MGSKMSKSCASSKNCKNIENLVCDFQHKSVSFKSHLSANKGQSYREVPKSSLLKKRPGMSSANRGPQNLRSESYEKSKILYGSKSNSGMTSQLDMKHKDSVASDIGFPNFLCETDTQERIGFPSFLCETDTQERIGFPTILCETDTQERIRSNAVDVKPVCRPGGKFLIEKQLYCQNLWMDWEKVTIESWNAWNGTWQVRGADGKLFPAAPIALKTKEEFKFLSRKRSFIARSFGSSSETMETML